MPSLQARATASAPNKQRGSKTTGVYTSLEQLMAFKRQASKLTLKKNQRAMQRLAGRYLSASKGRGMEFDDLRQYQPGDDIRQIDWKVTARTGTAHTKRFREEQDIPVFIILDLSQSLFFGSQSCMKSVMACDIAALLAWICQSQGDRLGAFIFNDNKHKDIRAKAGNKHCLQVLAKACEYNQALNINSTQPQTDAPLSQALEEASRVIKPGSQVFIISDFQQSYCTKSQGLNPALEKALQHLSRRNDVTAFHIKDQLEDDLANNSHKLSGRLSNQSLRFFNGQNIQQLHLNSGNKKALAQYHQNKQASIQQAFSQFAIPLIPSFTHEHAATIMQQYFQLRRSS